MKRKKQAGRSPAAFFAEWPLSDPAMRPTRSVTASAQALDHSLPGKPESSFPSLGLLSPRRPLRWVAAGAPLGAPGTAQRLSGPAGCPARAARGAAALVTKPKKEPGVDARPVLALSVRLSAAVGPRSGGRRGHRQTGGGYPPLRAWQLLYRPWSLRLNTVPARTGTGAASTGAGRRPPGGPRPRRRGRRRAAPPRSGCGWRTGPSWPAR